MLAQFERYHQKGIQSSLVVLRVDRENPLKMAFYETFESADEESHQQSSSEMVEAADEDKKAARNSNQKTKQFEGRRSLPVLLSRENSNLHPKNLKMPLPIPTRQNPLKSFDLISTVRRRSESRYLDPEDLHNISQSTEAQTQGHPRKDSNCLSAFSSQQLLSKKIDDLDDSELKLDECEQPFAKTKSHADQSDQIDPEENEIHAQPIHLSMYFDRPQPQYGSKSYRCPLENHTTPTKKIAPSPNSNSIRGSPSSLLTERPDELNHGYFDDKIKEDLLLKTELFSSRVTPTFLHNIADRHSTNEKKIPVTSNFLAGLDQTAV